MTANKKLNKELLIVRTVNQNLENKIINLEKQQWKSEQHNKRNNVEIPRILNKVSDQNFEQIVIKICKDSGIDVNPLDNEGGHNLPLVGNETNTNKETLQSYVSA